MKNEFTKIDVSNIKLDIVNILQNKYNKDIKVINNSNEMRQLKVPKFLEDESLLMAIDDFLDTLKNDRIHELKPSWIFDENNAVIISAHRKFYLTSKEVLFLKMLLKNDKITTYDEMASILWQGINDVSLNAMRVFTKNIKKKLPPKILKNFQDIGYKLELL